MIIPKLLIVMEDDLSLRARLVGFLTGKGYAAVGTDAGEQAIKILNTVRADALIVPSPNGQELLKDLESRRSISTIPAIAIKIDGQDSMEKLLLQLAAALKD